MRAKPFQFMYLSIFLGILGIFAWSSLAASEEPPTISHSGKIITLKIDGWTCASCEKDVHATLMGVSGVQSAKVSYSRSGAIVVVEPEQVTLDQLVQAIRGASNVFDTYEAMIIPNGSLAMEKNAGGLFGKFWPSLFSK